MLSKNHLLTFILTFLGYAGLHALRQGWSYSKKQIKDEFDIDQVWFGLIDTLYLASYSFGMMTIGNFSHKVQLKTFVSTGMFLAAIFYMGVAFSYQISGSLNLVVITILMCFNGFFQSTGWPGVMGIMGNWFQKGKTGVVMGIWAINANIGNIIANLVCNLLQTQFKASWVYNFIATGLIAAIVSICIFLFLKDKPQQIPQLVQEPIAKHSSRQKQKSTNIQDQNDQIDARKQQSIITSQDINKVQHQQLVERTQDEQKPKQVSVFRVFCYPRVPFYVIGYSMLKGCMYGLLFWLPTYLADKDLNSQKGYIASMIDVGSFIGGLYIGYLGDKYKYRAIFLSPLLLISSLVMFLSAFLLTNVAWQYYVSMFLIGISIGGPYNIIGTVITIDLGKHSKDGNNSSTPKISALIEGTAAFFAAASQLLLAVLKEQQIFYVFFLECIIAALVLMPISWSEWKVFRKQRIQSKQQQKINQ